MIDEVKEIVCPWHDSKRFPGDARVRAFILGRLQDEGFPVQRYLTLDPERLDAVVRKKMHAIVSFFTERFKIEPGQSDPIPWMVLMVETYQVMSFLSGLVPMIFALSTHASVTRLSLPELVSIVLGYDNEESQAYVSRLRNYGMLTLTSFTTVATKSDIAKANIATVLGQRLDDKRPTLFLDVKRSKNKAQVWDTVASSGLTALGAGTTDMIMDNSVLRTLDLAFTASDERDYGRI